MARQEGDRFIPQAFAAWTGTWGGDKHDGLELADARVTQRCDDADVWALQRAGDQAADPAVHGSFEGLCGGAATM